VCIKEELYNYTPVNNIVDEKRTLPLDVLKVKTLDGK
jgi:hypothetical protein